jgi:hypothetical protein
LESLSDNVDVNKPFGENVEISAKVSLGHYELKQHKQWFDEEYL